MKSGGSGWGAESTNNPGQRRLQFNSINVMGCLESNVGRYNYLEDTVCTVLRECGKDLVVWLFGLQSSPVKAKCGANESRCVPAECRVTD